MICSDGNHAVEREKEMFRKEMEQLPEQCFCGERKELQASLVSHRSRAPLPFTRRKGCECLKVLGTALNSGTGGDQSIVTVSCPSSLLSLCFASSVRSLVVPSSTASPVFLFPKALVLIS